MNQSSEKAVDWRNRLDRYKTVNDLKTFEKCIELLSAMVEREKELRIDAKTNSMLGSEFVMKQLFNGLATSRKAYYKTAEDYEKMELLTSYGIVASCIV